MPLIVWDEEKLGTAIKEVDDQHQRWIEIINELHEMLIGAAREVPHEETLEEMLDYCDYHFSAEERLMQEVGYPDYEAHKKAHDAFKYQLREMRRQMRSGDIVLRSQLLSTMKNWLEDHITVVDKRFGEFYTKLQS